METCAPAPHGFRARVRALLGVPTSGRVHGAALHESHARLRRSAGLPTANGVPAVPGERDAVVPVRVEPAGGRGVAVRAFLRRDVPERRRGQLGHVGADLV